MTVDIDAWVQRGTALSEQEQSALQQHFRTLSKDDMSAAWMRLTSRGLATLDLCKSVHRACARLVIESFGVPLNQQGPMPGRIIKAEPVQPADLKPDHGMKSEVEQFESARPWTQRCPDEASDEAKLASLLQRSLLRPQNPVCEFRFRDGVCRWAYLGRQLTDDEAVQVVRDICPATEAHPAELWAKEAQMRLDDMSRRALEWAKEVLSTSVAEQELKKRGLS